MSNKGNTGSAPVNADLPAMPYETTVAETPRERWIAALERVTRGMASGALLRRNAVRAMGAIDGVMDALHVMSGERPEFAEAVYTAHAELLEAMGGTT